MRHDRWQRLCLGLLCVMGLMTATVWAEEEVVASAKASDRVDEMMGRYNLYPAFEKLGRGASNALGGWLEIPFNIQTRYSQSDTGGSLLTGVAHGLLKAVVRTGVGVYEVATFFLPYPENYAPILPTLPYYKKTGRHEPLLLE